MGFGTNPIPLSDLLGANGPRDLAFVIGYGTIPEPGTIFALALGLAVLAIRRPNRLAAR
jgi:hypothetical protein